MQGGLGSGKTCLAKGIALGLGITEPLTSPTYTIIREYRTAEISLYHIDAYRLGGDEDFAEAGGIELIYSEGISLVEWSERIPRSLPHNAIIIKIAINENGSRVFRIESPELEKAIAART